MDQPPKLNDVPPRLRTFAREQRQTMPRAEALFWSQVRNGRFDGHKLKRQVPVLSNLDVVMNTVGAAIEQRGSPSPASLREAPSPAEGGGFSAPAAQQVIQ